MTEGAQRPDEPGSTETSFDDLFRREFTPITRTAYLVVGDWEVAREIAQDAFVQALRNWPQVQRLERPGGWVRRVAIRDAVRSRDRDARRRTLPVGPAPGSGDTTATAVDVRTALLTLPARQRAVIALYYLDDLPVGEIAALLDCSTGTVKTHLARGRHSLAALLGEEANDELR
jgi:RNA polymerase sigma-70 factor, ECF subfamily